MQVAIPLFPRFTALDAIGPYEVLQTVPSIDVTNLKSTYANVCRIAQTPNEVIIDFAKYPKGRRVILQNSSPKNNRSYENTNKIMAFDVVSDATDTSNNSVPDSLNPGNEIMALQESQSVATRRFRFEREHGSWAIND